MTKDTAPRSRTEGEQATMGTCEYCGGLFPPSRRQSIVRQRFCKDKCRAAHTREHGMQGTVVSLRRLKTRTSITLHSTDERIVLSAAIGARFRLVREP